jgi:hypothetical protein
MTGAAKEGLLSLCMAAGVAVHASAVAQGE